MSYDPSTRFQRQLHDFILKVKPEIMVETGFETGVSAEWSLKAMDTNGVGVLYSVDSTTQVRIDHPRLHFISGLSQVWLDKIYTETGPWDVFLHDSDHGFECQQFEYQKAMQCVKPGGYILSDDYEWANHRAWQKFLVANGISKTFNLGCVQGFQKP